MHGCLNIWTYEANLFCSLVGPQEKKSAVFVHMSVYIYCMLLAWCSIYLHMAAAWAGTMGYYSLVWAHCIWNGAGYTPTVYDHFLSHRTVMGIQTETYLPYMHAHLCAHPHTQCTASTCKSPMYTQRYTHIHKIT